MKIAKGIIIGFLSILYGLGVQLRNYLYNKKILKSNKYPVKIISIGNLTSGGTGKTPMAEWLIRKALKRNITVAYISRGYGRKKSGVIEVDINVHSSHDVGDEALQVASKFQNIIVIVAEDRCEGIEYLLQKNKVDLVILDDAFQHRKIHRDVDIVMIDSIRPPHLDYFLPLGNLREPLKSINRAQLLVFNKAEDFTPDELSNLKAKYHFKNKIVVNYKPIELVSVYQNDTILPLEVNKRKPCMALSGIGNSLHFERTLHKSGFEVIKSLTFSDHHVYTEKEIKMIKGAYKKYSKKDIFTEKLIIITTEKDFRRMQNNALFMEFAKESNMYFLSMSLTLQDKSEMPVIDGFLERLETTIK